MPTPWALLSQGAEPTIAHWLAGVQERSGVPWIRLDPQRPNDVDAATVVVVRTVPPCWLMPLAQLRSQGCRVVLLLDDDLLTPRSLIGLPWRYRWPDDIRDEVLARLLALNAERYAEEVAQGLHSKGRKTSASGAGKKPGRPAKAAVAESSEQMGLGL